MRNILLVPFVLLMGLSQVPSSGRGDDEKIESIYAFRRISEDLVTSGQMRYDQIELIKKAGFDVIVNLAVADKVRNALEGYLATELGLAYVQIPVDWKNPSLRDLDLFFEIMDAFRDKKIYVHCFANKRASTFTFLYRTLRLGVAEDVARQDLRAIWDPATEKQWESLIEQARSRRVTDPR